MGPARIYPWRKMHRSRAPSIAPGTFFVAQPWADCITNMPGFNLRQAQAALGHSRNAVLSAASFLFVPEIVSQSDFVALVPERLVHDRTDKLKLIDCPFPVEGFAVGMAWHERSHGHS